MSLSVNNYERRINPSNYLESDPYNYSKSLLIIEQAKRITSGSIDHPNADIDGINEPEDESEIEFQITSPKINLHECLKYRNDIYARNYNIEITSNDECNLYIIYSNISNIN